MSAITMNLPVPRATTIGAIAIASHKAGFCITSLSYLDSVKSKRRGQRFNRFSLKAISTIEDKELVFSVVVAKGIPLNRICANNLTLESYELFENGRLVGAAHLLAGFLEESLEAEYIASIIESLPVLDAIQQYMAKQHRFAA